VQWSKGSRERESVTRSNVRYLGCEVFREVAWPKMSFNKMQKSSYAQEPKDAERESAIGQRLRDFRETQMIPRTRLAVAVNIGNERLASYETGRAPLPYGI